MLLFKRNIVLFKLIIIPYYSYLILCYYSNGILCYYSKGNIIRYYSKETLYVTTRTKRYTLLLKRNIIRYLETIQKKYCFIHTYYYNLLFILNIICYYTNLTLYITIQMKRYTLLLKRKIIRYYSN
jgi:hypothetical protein